MTAGGFDCVEKQSVNAGLLVSEVKTRAARLKRQFPDISNFSRLHLYE
jgi:hypothetical protein